MWTVRLCAAALLPIRLQTNRWIGPSRLADGPMGREDFCFGYTCRLYHGYVPVISPLQAIPDGMPPLVGDRSLAYWYYCCGARIIYAPGGTFFSLTTVHRVAFCDLLCGHGLDFRET